MGRQGGKAAKRGPGVEALRGTPLAGAGYMEFGNAFPFGANACKGS